MHLFIRGKTGARPLEGAMSWAPSIATLPNTYIVDCDGSEWSPGTRFMVIQLWQLVEAITIVITIPVLALEYYWVILLGTSTRYPRDMASQDVRLENHPTVSVLIASFNEKFVIERTLDAVKQIDYPKDKLQVVVADDSDDQTVEVIDAKARELNSLGISPSCRGGLTGRPSSAARSTRRWSAWLGSSCCSSTPTRSSPVTS
jgi:hypothetical protein